MITLTLKEPYISDHHTDISTIVFMSTSGIVDEIRVDVTGVGIVLADRLRGRGVPVTEFIPKHCHSTAIHKPHYCPGIPHDHEQSCCTEHDTHTSPHKGCVLR